MIDVKKLYIMKGNEDKKKDILNLIKKDDVDIDLLSKKTIADVINRLYNCKFTSAYEYAFMVEGFPIKVLKALSKASYDFGNSGWGGNLIMKTGEKLCGMLGYKYSEVTDYFYKVRKRDKFKR